MSFVYLTEKGINVRIKDGRMLAISENLERSIPIESIEGLVVTEGLSFSSDALINLLKFGIPVTYMSGKAKYMDA